MRLAITANQARTVAGLHEPVEILVQLSAMRSAPNAIGVAASLAVSRVQQPTVLFASARRAVPFLD
ncbi:hypothetical protein Sthe_2561 [Sphaerobacter thermophilus DSM 20745]|uniref:Uncharacterized protein n=1 Tax=Sphaerobacter thermophilus (strain ATCC 49802 / DSM 20745 / KCCM 41009 / NCIMB 13125 / S 6022) TaxID=479434 RepID=D1C833_SPHTD|nr:hypothetical protein Sthe_2561 [Sphaerobacter thermophilus DSM 20745]